MPRSFRFLEKLGRGAFGEVHLAELHTDDDFVQTVAVKWLHAEFSDDVELAGRLRDEARLLGLLQHPNVVRVSGLTRIDGRLAVLMEPVDGRDLSGAHVPPRAAADIIASVADALDAAWETIPPGRTEPLRVVHRDIKPSNIMVTGRGLVKVMDFGVARATFETREAQTRSQQYGTARYMAPERWIDGIAEAPSDVFSLGITLVELASGEAVARPRLSREGFEADLGEALGRLAQWPALQALANQMVAFAPEDRPSAAEVGQRIAALDLPGIGVREWARTLEPAKGAPDARTGTVVVEDTSADTFALDADLPPTAPLTGSSPTSIAQAGPQRRAPWPLWVGLGALALAAVLALGSLANTRGPTALPPPVPSSQPAPLPEPEPEPELEASPVPESEPTTEPEPVAVRPRPTPSAPVVPAPAPVPDVATPEAAPQVTLIFELDAGLSTRIAGRQVSSGRTAVQVPAGEVLPIEVLGPDGRFGCSILAGEATEIWQIRADGRCVKTG